MQKSRRSFLGLSALALATLAAFWWGGEAGAHEIEVLQSEPPAGAVLESSPSQVRIEFNEEVQSGASRVEVLDVSGHAVDSGDGGVDLSDPQHASLVVSLPALPEGAYTVRWRAVLLDGDASEGEFAFFVGKAGRAVALTSPGSAGEDPEGRFLPWFLGGLAVLLAVSLAVAAWIRARRREISGAAR